MKNQCAGCQANNHDGIYCTKERYMPHQDEKLREEFRNKMKYLWDKYGEEYEIYNPEAFEEELHDFLISYIHHEREQLIELLEKEVEAMGSVELLSSKLGEMVSKDAVLSIIREKKK